MEEERSSGGLGRWALVAVAVGLFMWKGLPALKGENNTVDRQPLGGIVDDLAPPAPRPDEAICRIDGGRFVAELTTRGAALRRLTLTDAKYTTAAGKPIDLVPDNLRDEFLPLRTELRPATIHDDKLTPSDNLVAAGDATQQVSFDDLDFKLGAHDAKSCTFTYADASTSITKTIAATGSPFELALTLTIENLADQPKKHRLAIEEGDWRTSNDMEGHLGRQSEWLTESVAATVTKTERHGASDFEASDFKKKEFDDEKWRQTPGDAKFAAVSSAFFARVVAPVESAKPPRAETRAEEVWDTARFGTDKKKDPNHGFVFRARLTYPPVELAPKQTVTYKAVSFTGPKERDVLAAVGNDISGVLNLGTFSFIGKWLVWYLYKLKALTHSWGFAIMLLTITVRFAVFPLSVAQIKSTAQMRKLKPELDELNKRYKDDMTQRGLATQELYRKHGMNQFGQMAGCLPMILTLPVWWALYTALQTAVELYHTPFLWFVDLSAPDKFYIIPVVLGATSFLQQKLMPPQTDPSQQKMMMYMMPGIFTVMMLFLPSGLGLYMFTSSLVSIAQQFVVERYMRSRQAAGIVVTERLSGDDKASPSLGKGKARVRG
jgi:YidC/Oxa1 family membrane protein insertase